MERTGIAGPETRGVHQGHLGRVVHAGRAPEPCASCGSRHLSICSAIEERDLARLAELAQSESYEAGRSFIQEDDPATAFFNVTSGTVRLFKLLPDGRRQITGFAGPGDFLGLAVSPRYAASAEAVDRVEACRFARPKLQRMLHDFPALEERLLAVAVSELAAAQEQMLLLGRKTARERLASFLVAAATDRRPCAPPRTRLHLPMTRGDIADYLGLTIETVSRTFTRLKTERLIALHGASEVEILDPPALRALADATA
jgi:CRP/FNR family transcriptional regulator